MVSHAERAKSKRVGAYKFNGAGHEKGRTGQFYSRTERKVPRAVYRAETVKEKLVEEVTRTKGMDRKLERERLQSGVLLWGRGSETSGAGIFRGIVEMKHLGDITKISGYEAPLVDVIIGGSPCQDLSVAGKRAGLNGVRSGLFMDQIRIIKEMREASEKSGAAEIRPRYMVWENVPGAFSSNDGDDFRVVLEETARIADKGAVIPRPANRKWRTCGFIMGDGWSVAWRVLDAQFWGVPQRRRRIALVADFGGESAPKYYLSERACKGVLRRAEKRGKELPPILKEALERQSGLTT